ncbi:uncharacterized protein QC761_104350 [Podospora bellae-mahoneyi]|uniref:Uncharacterized protein n=1 Tax=Podospora bellae-mahoneyi TaxID=2093777 RepID=A0ABR0FXQ9_9PEZI|nr:hypothetical protein QC761_104350 [Podospora bellae-mahoneyi]
MGNRPNCVGQCVRNRRRPAAMSLRIGSCPFFLCHTLSPSEASLIETEKKRCKQHHRVDCFRCKTNAPHIHIQYIDKNIFGLLLHWRKNWGRFGGCCLFPGAASLVPPSESDGWIRPVYREGITSVRGGALPEF